MILQELEKTGSNADHFSPPMEVSWSTGSNLLLLGCQIGMWLHEDHADAGKLEIHELWKWVGITTRLEGRRYHRTRRQALLLDKRSGITAEQALLQDKRAGIPFEVDLPETVKAELKIGDQMSKRQKLSFSTRHKSSK